MSDANQIKLFGTAIAAAGLGAGLAHILVRHLESSQNKNDSNVAGSDDLGSMVTNKSSAGGATSGTLSKAPRTTSFIYPDEHILDGASLQQLEQPNENARRVIATRFAIEDEIATPRNSVTVRVPASSANFGPGFDCIGMAVDLWSEVTVSRSDAFVIEAHGEGCADVPKDSSNLLVTGVKAAYDVAGKDMPPLKFVIESRIPYARGLGSSSAAVVAGIIAGLVLAGHRLPVWGSEALLQIAASIEGHPDNVAPVIYGGIQLGIHSGTRWVTERIPCPAGLQLVAFVPDFVGKTSVARDVLQSTVSRTDAVYNGGRIAMLVHSLCMGNLENLKYGVQDRLHQPHRADALYSHLYAMIRAAEDAGACCAFLSGAGPSVMALTSGASGDIFTQREKERTDYSVAKAMKKVAESSGIKGKIMVTQVSNEGAQVVRVDPPFSTENITFRDHV